MQWEAEYAFRPDVRVTGSVLLFVPGDRPERFSKAAAAKPDLVVVDLEDAVPASRKAPARQALHRALAGGLIACVRVNDVRSEEGALDLAMLAGSHPFMVMIPKARNVEDLAAVSDSLPNVPLIVLIETIDGVRSVEALAKGAGVRAIAFGAYDLCAELGSRPLPDVLATYRSRIVFAARAAGIGAIDAPYLDLNDDAGLAVDSIRAVDFGFDAKLAIHPRQVNTIRAAFIPSTTELGEARAIVTAAAGGGVIEYGGRMIDAPLVAAARRIIERGNRQVEDSTASD